MTSVSFFLDNRGNNPVGDFLDENKEIKVKASIIIKNIIEFGLVTAIPHIKKLWEKSDPEYQLSRQIIKKRLENKMSQQELARKAGTTQAIISRLENSTFNPSLNLLKRVSTGLKSKLNIQI